MRQKGINVRASDRPEFQSLPNAEKRRRIRAQYRRATKLGLYQFHDWHGYTMPHGMYPYEHNYVDRNLGPEFTSEEIEEATELLRCQRVFQEQHAKSPLDLQIFEPQPYFHEIEVMARSLCLQHFGRLISPFLLPSPRDAKRLHSDGKLFGQLGYVRPGSAPKTQETDVENASEDHDQSQQGKKSTTNWGPTIDRATSSETPQTAAPKSSFLGGNLETSRADHED